MRSGNGSPTLVLVPTAVELRRMLDQGGFPAGSALVHVCGFGAIAAAARTADLVARLRPARIVLVGIAGTFDAATLPVGDAIAFDAVAIEGIGAGEGAALVGPMALGFPQWPGGNGGASEPIHDHIPLARSAAREIAPGRASKALHGGALLLTTCAASASPEQGRVRRARFPEALAEDMEGFGVALAATLAGVPVSIVRGISNVVGDREPAQWRIPAALAAARVLAVEVACGAEHAP